MSEVYSGAVDRGLEGVVACTTAISSIVDATLCYRGYTIEDLAEHSTFEEVAFLLWNDRLPKEKELESFMKEMGKHMHLSPDLVKVLQSLPTSSVHPMAWLRSSASLLSLWDSEAQAESIESRHHVAMRLLARFGTLVSLLERTRQGKEYLAPQPEKGIAWNFLYLLKGKEPDPELVKVLDVCLILHADHELNCSAFSARVTASSLSDIYSAVTSAIGALKGPLHGGANEQVMKMLLEIGTVEKARSWVRDALEHKQKVMGFGHRVYKNGDPRAKILSKMSEQLTKKIGKPELFEMSHLIHETVEGEKGLLPNVDFYSATVYYSMGIPIDLFTPVFAVSRVSGWLAHIMEQYAHNRIYRPRGEWTGKKDLKWVPVTQRS